VTLKEQRNLINANILIDLMKYEQRPRYSLGSGQLGAMLGRVNFHGNIGDCRVGDEQFSRIVFTTEDADDTEVAKSGLCVLCGESNLRAMDAL
jgi:hypothetical protein